MADFARLNIPEALEESLAAADHLRESDAAAVATARTLAVKLQTLLDAEFDSDEVNPGKVLFGSQPFMQALKALNLDPQSRMAAAIETIDKRSKVADMKAERERRNRRSA